MCPMVCGLQEVESRITIGWVESTERETHEKKLICAQKCYRGGVGDTGMG